LAGGCSEEVFCRPSTALVVHPDPRDDPYFATIEIFNAKILRPTSRTVQGYPRSKVMVPIDSPLVVSWYLIVFEIFDAKIL